MTTTTINVGRVFTTKRGLFGIRLGDGTEVLGPGGEGLTKEVATRLLDAIERRHQTHEHTTGANRTARVARVGGLG
jgi:hypothetical protein